MVSSDFESVQIKNSNLQLYVLNYFEFWHRRRMTVNIAPEYGGHFLLHFSSGDSG